MPSGCSNDSLRSARPYRGAWPEERVRGYLTSQSGRHFDPRAVDLFLEMLADESVPEHTLLSRAA